MSNKDYNAGLDTAASIVEEMLGGTSEGETLLCGIESSKKNIGEEVRPLICDPEHYPEDAESPYCEKCDSCGETGCCPPIYCEAVKCKYGEINLKDYSCFQEQWGIMYNALEDIAQNYNLDDNNIFRQHLVQIASDALKAVDKKWDTLYGKQ